MMPPQKITLEGLRDSMQTFLDFPQVEASLRREIDETVGRIMLTRAQNGGRPAADVMTDYLDAGNATEERLKFIVGICGGSMERIKRVYAAMFPRASWPQLKTDARIRRTVAEFLIRPDSASTFIPAFIRASFVLPANWIELLRDETYLRAVAHNLAQSKYAVRAGVALEEAATAVVSECGVAFMKGPVELVDNKEVDIAIPDLDDPRILIMSSYQLTTASSQSSKANEQARMYQAVQTYNRSRRRSGRPQTLFVNIIDGGGWLARRNDLAAMWRECDYCFAHAGLDGLRELLYNCFEQPTG